MSALIRPDDERFNLLGSREREWTSRYYYGGETPEAICLSVDNPSLTPSDVWNVIEAGLTKLGIEPDAQPEPESPEPTTPASTVLIEPEENDDEPADG